jgi:hypothetical protein
MKTLILPRRRWLVAAAAFTLWAGAVHAAPPVVEIIAFAHPPVQSALKPLRDWLAGQGARLDVIEIDMESPAAEKRLQAVGVKGHVPIVVLVDGQFRHRRADGSAVEFAGFPAGPGTPPGVKGTWSAADVEAVIGARMR